MPGPIEPRPTPSLGGQSPIEKGGKFPDPEKYVLPEQLHKPQGTEQERKSILHHIVQNASPDSVLGKMSALQKEFFFDAITVLSPEEIAPKMMGFLSSENVSAEDRSKAVEGLHKASLLVLEKAKQMGKITSEQFSQAEKHVKDLLNKVT